MPLKHMTSLTRLDLTGCDDVTDMAVSGCNFRAVWITLHLVTPPPPPPPPPSLPSQPSLPVSAQQHGKAPVADQ